MASRLALHRGIGKPTRIGLPFGTSCSKLRTAIRGPIGAIKSAHYFCSVRVASSPDFRDTLILVTLDRIEIAAAASTIKRVITALEVIGDFAGF